jgi:hypothetical protein
MPVAYTILYYTPHVMAVIFLVFLFCSDAPKKGRFLARATVAVALASFLAHLNRIFHYDPAYLYFPSGHMTFCFGVSLSLAMLWPWTLCLTLPSLVVFGRELVFYHCHTTSDVLGAIPLVLIVYGIIHALWKFSPVVPLDSAKVSL